MHNPPMSVKGKPGARSVHQSRRRLTAGCPSGYVWDHVLRKCKKGKAPPIGKYPPGTCAPGYIWDPILQTCKPGKEPSIGPIQRVRAQRARAHHRARVYLASRGIRPAS